MKPFERGALREQRGRLLSFAWSKAEETGSGTVANFGVIAVR